jgi:hypothetical protein
LSPDLSESAHAELVRSGLMQLDQRMWETRLKLVRQEEKTRSLELEISAMKSSCHEMMLVLQSVIAFHDANPSQLSPFKVSLNPKP